jgi:AcrR family transcriptional regulator
MNTREKILDKALEMFNERGIEYVGLRELATVLNIRVGNITYYFPTKDDLVFELSAGLRERNSGVMVAKDQMTMLTFLEMLHQVFRNHLHYRCLLLSFVHLMAQNQRIATAYKKTQKMRYETLRENLDLLSGTGYLKAENENDIQFLVSTIALISRFWISEAAISFRQLSDDAQMQHYLQLIAKLLMPYATGKGKREIKMFIQRLN